MIASFYIIIIQMVLRPQWLSGILKLEASRHVAAQGDGTLGG